jgi:tetratricopeptide (TPR) repeat protein
MPPPAYTAGSTAATWPSFDANCFIQLGQFEEALAAAQEYEQLGRSAGRDDPARSAFLLAKLGRISEAAAAADESLRRLLGLHPARRPHNYLARALWELGRNTEAISHARAAYRQAWANGPPHCDHWVLRDVRELLQAMGVPLPDLPTIDPATVTVPLEREIRDFIAAQETKRP